MATTASPDRPETGPDLQQADVDEQGPEKASRQILPAWPVTTALGFATLGYIVRRVVFVAFLEYGQARPRAQAAPAEAR
jgi:hypothetical protein